MTSLPNVGPMQSKCSRFYLGYKKCVEWAQNPKDCYPYWDDYQECIHPAKERVRARALNRDYNVSTAEELQEAFEVKPLFPIADKALEEERQKQEQASASHHKTAANGAIGVALEKVVEKMSSCLPRSS